MSPFEFLPPDPALASLMHAWREDPEQPRYGSSEDSTIERLKERLARATADFARVEKESAGANEVFFFVRDPETNALVGHCGLHAIDPAGGVAEIGYAVAPEHRGRRLATRMVTELASRAFRETSLRRLVASVHEENSGSRKTIEAAGFTLEGIARERVLIDGAPANHAIYSLLRSDAERSAPTPSYVDTTVREVVEGDALAYLRARSASDFAGCSFFGSLPDISEFPSYSLSEWREWFRSTAALLFERTPPEGVTLFFQSDIKREGEWVDKAHLVQTAAESVGSRLLWHKILCRAPPDRVTFGRPSYSHLLCFSRDLRDAPEWATPDVWSDMGPRTWARGTGENAARIACRYVRDHTTTRTLVNPFCGEGMILNVANQHGLDAIGIERSRKRAERARSLGREARI